MKKNQKTLKERYGDLHLHYSKISKIGTQKIDYKERNEKIKETCIKKYGVNFTTQAKEIQEKMEETRLKKYNSKSMFGSKYFKEKAKETFIKNYGADNPFKSEIIKEKIKQTNLEKYGYEHNSQVPEIKEKRIKTNLEKYNYPYALQAPSVKEKIKQTNLEKYKVTHSSQKYIQNYKDYNIKGFEEFIKDGYFKKDECKDYFKISNNAVYRKRKEFDIQEPTELQYCKKQNEFLDKFSNLFNIKIERNIIIENKKPGGFFISKNDILIKKNIDFTKVKTHIPFDFKDIFIPKNTKVILEFDGDYFHGFLNNDLINEISNCKMKELYIQTIQRALFLRKNGYKVIKIWEYYYDNFKDFYNYLEDYDNLY